MNTDALRTLTWRLDGLHTLRKWVAEGRVTVTTRELSTSHAKIDLTELLAPITKVATEMVLAELDSQIEKTEGDISDVISGC